jgi:hypothetical protein
MRNICVLLMFLLAGCADSIISVHRGRIPENYRVFGYYSLPKTALKIQIPITRLSFVSGIVKSSDSACVNKVLRNEFGWEPVEAPKETFVIDQKILLQPVTLPDPNKTFAIAYAKSKALAKTINVSLSRDGLIQSGEFAQESKVFEIIRKGAELTGSAIGSIASLGKKGVEATTSCDNDSIKDQRVVHLIKNAKMLADARHGIVVDPSGINNTDILKAHLAAIDKQLKLVKDQLTGALSKKVYNITLYVEPQNDFQEIVLLKLNPAKGVVSDGSDKWSSLSPEISTTERENFKVLKLKARKLAAIGQATFGKQVNNAGDNPNTQLNTEAFLYYNLPAKYELTMLYGNEQIPTFASGDQKEGSGDYQVYFPQLGELAYLPVDFKESSITYYEDTGSLKSAKFVKAATVDAEKVQAAYEALDSIRTALNALKESQTAQEAEVVEQVEEQVIQLDVESE